MQTHVKVLGVLHIVVSCLSLLAAILMVVIFGGVAGIVGASGDPDAALAVPIIGAVGVFVVVFMLVTSLPGLIVGIGLLKFRSWARIFGIVISVLELFFIPFGTALGIYGLWVLLSKDTEPLFRAAPAVV